MTTRSRWIEMIIEYWSLLATSATIQAFTSHVYFPDKFVSWHLVRHFSMDIDHYGIKVITKINISDVHFQRQIKTRRLKVDEDIRGEEKLGSNVKFMTNQKIMQGTSVIQLSHRTRSYYTLKDYRCIVLQGCLYITSASSASITTKGCSNCWQTLTQML